LRHAGVLGAVGTAEEEPIRFDSVSDDLASAVIANWSEGVDSAFETVEDV